MVPIGTSVAAVEFPGVVVGLVIANAAVWLVQSGLPPHLAEEFILRNALVPVRFTDPAAALALGLGPGNYLSFVTNSFMHAGWGHLIVNMWTLWLFGRPLENRLGAVRFLALYLACGWPPAWLTSPSTSSPPCRPSGRPGPSPAFWAAMRFCFRAPRSTSWFRSRFSHSSSSFRPCSTPDCGSCCSWRRDSPPSRSRLRRRHRLVGPRRRLHRRFGAGADRGHAPPHGTRDRVRPRGRVGARRCPPRRPHEDHRARPVARQDRRPGQRRESRAYPARRCGGHAPRRQTLGKQGTMGLTLAALRQASPGGGRPV